MSQAFLKLFSTDRTTESGPAGFNIRGGDLERGEIFQEKMGALGFGLYPAMEAGPEKR